MVSCVRCIKVLESSRIPSKDGYFVFKNLSIHLFEEFTLCAKFKSYKFGLTQENSIQNIIYHGDRSMLGVVTNQHCDHLAEGCTNNNRQDHLGTWEHGRSYGYHQYLGDWEVFKIWRPTVWNTVCILASATQRLYKIFMNGEFIQDSRYVHIIVYLSKGGGNFLKSVESKSI